MGGKVNKNAISLFRRNLRKSQVISMALFSQWIVLRTCYGRTAGLEKRAHLHLPGNGKRRFRWADTFHKKNIQGSNKNTVTKPIHCNENSYVKIGRCQGYE